MFASSLLGLKLLMTSDMALVRLLYCWGSGRHQVHVVDMHTSQPLDLGSAERQSLRWLRPHVVLHGIARCFPASGVLCWVALAGIDICLYAPNRLGPCDGVRDIQYYTFNSQYR
jgi:hypothetical protein